MRSKLRQNFSAAAHSAAPIAPLLVPFSLTLSSTYSAILSCSCSLSGRPPRGFGSSPPFLARTSARKLTTSSPTFTPPFPSFRFFKGLRRRAGLLAPQELGWLDCYWSG